MNEFAKTIFDRGVSMNRDYVAAMVDADEKVDHSTAKARGQRISDIAEHIAAAACAVEARPIRPDIYNAAVEILAGWLYPGSAVDLPAKRR